MSQFMEYLSRLKDIFRTEDLLIIALVIACILLMPFFVLGLKKRSYVRIISLIVLAFTSKNSRAPKAEGIPYDKGAR